MKKKDYRKPTMQVVKLQHQCHILTVSEKGQGSLQNYQMENEQDW